MDFYSNTKEKRFKLAILGWGLWVIASTASIYSGFISDALVIDFFLFLNMVFVALGTIFYIWTIFSYFLEVSTKLMIVIISSLILVLSLIFIIIGYRLANTIAVLLVSIILLSVYIVPALKWKKFKESMGLALKWYYVFLISLAIYMVISIYISSQGLGYYGIYSMIDIGLIILNYVPSMIFYIALIILLIHVEYNYSSTETYELKDKYSHKLGNVLQFIRGYIDITSHKPNLDQKEAVELQELFEEKCNEASNILKEIRDL